MAAVHKRVILFLLSSFQRENPSQVALRWLIENPIVLPIPGAKNSQQVTENAGALSFSLSPEEVEALSQATVAWRNQ